jgi:hypothetical protein
MTETNEVLMAYEIVDRGTQVALGVASAAAPGTFAASLSDRTPLDQGIITGLAVGSHFLLTVVAQDSIDWAGSVIAPSLPLPESWSLHDRERAATFLLDLAVIPAGFALVKLLPFRDPEPLWRATVRHIAWRYGVTGISATVLSAGHTISSGLDEAAGANGKIERVPLAIPLGLLVAAGLETKRQREVPKGEDAAPAFNDSMTAIGASAGVMLALGALAVGERKVVQSFGLYAGRRLPGSEDLWRRLGHLVLLGGVGFATHQLWDRAMNGIDTGSSTFEPGMDDSVAGLWTNPMVSGDPESLVSWKSLGREGRRHAITYVRPEKLQDKPAEFEGHKRPELSIKTVMQEEARAVPIQVFVGLDSAATPTERVELALAEMDRTDAWSRSMLMLCSPTGSGYVNYVAIACAQYMTRGDVASVTLQYSKRPSPLSLGKIEDAREQNRLLWLRIFEKLREMAPEDRPKVVLFGESLGAWTSQNVLIDWGTLGVQALGIDRALWIGTPAGSKWMHQVTGPDRPDVDKSLLAVVNDYEQFSALPNRDAVRYVLLSHDNDGVTKFSPELLVKRPDWMGPKRPQVELTPEEFSPRGVLPSLRWRPVTSFYQLLIDMKNAQIPGAYRAWAHDYRPDLPDFIREVYDLEVTDEQLVRIKSAVQEREEFREEIFK